MVLKRELVGYALVVVLVAAGWLLIAKPEQERATRLSRELSAIEERAEEVDRTVALLEATKREMARIRETAAALKPRLLKERDVPRVLAEVSKEARESDIRILSMRPLEEKAKGDPYQRLPVELELQGPYLKVGRFLEMLANGPLLFTFENLSLKRDGKDASSITLKGIVVAYIQRRER
ncbi:MAG: type 4a pilus biogenesis protein PilO [candidate division NC10 bacterium]|nr:type 4a pilus biogenesis protein PilO [candidate division NC10 bacterium]